MNVSDLMHSRTIPIVGERGLSILQSSHVLVVGLGGVGGYAAEMLCRAGIGRLTIVDGDSVSVSNLNRQIIATHSALGQPKAELFASRFRNINPNVEVVPIVEFLRDERMKDLLSLNSFDFVVDAIDSLSPKVYLLYHAYALGIPIVSSMGSAGKMDPSKVIVDDISKSYNCPLAAHVRKRLHRMDVYSGIQVVFSSEKSFNVESPRECGAAVRGTISYIPAVFGCMCASVVIRNLINKL